MPRARAHRSLQHTTPIRRTARHETDDRIRPPKALVETLLQVVAVDDPVMPIGEKDVVPVFDEPHLNLVRPTDIGAGVTDVDVRHDCLPPTGVGLLEMYIRYNHRPGTSIGLLKYAASPCRRPAWRPRSVTATTPSGFAPAPHP